MQAVQGRWKDVNRGRDKTCGVGRHLFNRRGERTPLFPPESAALRTAVVEWLFPGVDNPLSMVMLGQLASALPVRSHEYFVRTREAAFGGPLYKLCVGAAREEQWAALEAGLGKIVGWLATNGPGKDILFMGDKVSYVDMQLVSILSYKQTVLGRDSADWKRVAGLHDGTWARLMEYYDQWVTIV